MTKKPIYDIEGYDNVPLDFMKTYIDDATKHYWEEYNRIIEYYKNKYCFRKVEEIIIQHSNVHYLMIYTDNFTVVVRFTLGLDLTDFIHPNLNTHIKRKIQETRI